MEKAQAIKLIEKLFDHKFEESVFVQFCSNLLEGFDTAKSTSVQAGNYVYEPYRNHIKSFKRVGQYTDPDGELVDILTVNVHTGHKLERTRTGLRNFAIEYLKRKEHRDTLLIAFYSDDSNDWRLSYVKLEYKTFKDEKGRIKARQEAISAKRYSFLVGETEPCHTAKKQFLPLLTETSDNPTIQDIEKCFNIEKVTRDFFEQYKTLYLNLLEKLEKLASKEKDIKKYFESKNIDTFAFAKKLLGQIVFLYFIQKKGWLGVPKDTCFGKGDKRFLKTLFDKAESTKENFFNDYLEHLFYEALAVQRTSVDPSYYKRFDCRIPFLNGGLFEPMKDYDWKNTEIALPNEIFSNNEMTREGDIGTGILDVFDRYNFTVKEDEPLEKEVAVDPEMLGKVFENLLEVKDRKSKGAFYTPREIVHYMCQESLINYLDTTLNSYCASHEEIGNKQIDIFGNKVREGQLKIEIEHKDIKIPKEDIEEFIKNSHLVVEDNRKDKKSYQLPDSIQKHSKLFDKALGDIKVCDPAIGSGAFPVGMLNEIVRARTALTPYMGKKETDDDDRTQYHLKRECIQNSLYGVDIDDSAIDVAKLRLWLSLVVDEESIQDIEPLPNLDYKIVCGNSLLGIKIDAFNAPLFVELEDKKKEYFSATDRKEKLKLDKEIDGLIHKISNGREDFDFEVYFSEVWHEKNGFDIVIGNPPYGADIEKSDLVHIKNKLVDTSNTNSAAIFIDFAKNVIINGNGIVSFIVPKSLLYSEKWFTLATILSMNTSVLVDVEKAFDNVKLEQVVFVYNKAEKVKTYNALKFIDDNFASSIFLDIKNLQTYNAWICDVTEVEINISKKLIKNCFLLKQISSTKRGVGLQKYLVEKGEFPLIGGKNISRYTVTGVKGFVSNKIVEQQTKKVNYMLQKKIISQDLIAHIRNPKPHIKIMSHFDNSGKTLGLDTVQNTVLKDKNYSYWLITAILNSKIISWYVYKFIYCSAIRTMHFDNYYIGKIPIPNVAKKNTMFDNLVEKINNQYSVELDAEIDARVAHLYSLIESEYQLILEGTEDTFRITALNYFRDIQKGIMK